MKLLEKLEQIYHTAQNSTTNQLLLSNLLDFMSELIKDPLSESVQKSVLKAASTDLKRLDALEKSALDELESIHIELKNYQRDLNIKHIPCSEFVDMCYFDALGHEDPKYRISSTCPLIMEKAAALTHEFLKLLETSKENNGPNYDYISKMAIIDCPSSSFYISNPTNIQLHLLHYDAWLRESDRLEIAKTLSMWYHWDVIAWIYNTYKEGDLLSTEYRLNGNIFEAERINALRQSLLTLTIPEKYSVNALCSPFPTDLIKRSLRNVWFHIQDIASAESPKTQEYSPSTDDIKPSNTQKFNYNHDLATVNIMGYSVTFLKNSRATGYLNVISTAPKQLWEWDEIYESIEGKEPEKNRGRNKKYQRSLYDSYGHINKQISQQTEGNISDFLSFNMKTCKINPLFL